MWITPVCGLAACCGGAQNHLDVCCHVAFSTVDGLRHSGQHRNEQMLVLFLNITKPPATHTEYTRLNLLCIISSFWTRFDLCLSVSAEGCCDEVF